VSTKSCRPLPRDLGWKTHAGLPQDFIGKAVNRLGVIGLLTVAAHPLLHIGGTLLIPEDVRRAYPMPPSYFLAMALSVVLGLAIYILSRTRKLNSLLILDIGLIFEVVGAFCIGVIVASRDAVPRTWDISPGGIPFWITVFVLVVPNTPGKTALAAFASASMAPIALLVERFADNQPAPAALSLLARTFPNLLAAVIAMILSKFVYNLGRDVAKAREMGSYRLVELLGRGGMGEVWRAEHRLLARPAAIKLIQPEVLGGADSNERSAHLRRFEREAQATAMLSSPHTIQLYDFGIAEDGVFYYVMELLHGVDLETLVEKYGPLAPERVAHVLSQVCSSLEEAHQDGLVHRDVKPANIFTCQYGLEYDFVKVLDFGIAKSTQNMSQRTTTLSGDSITGTPGFMAPEMALGREVDARADIYAIGCVGYWLLTGRFVFEEETFVATLLAHANKPPIPPSQRTEIEIPRELEELVMWCLQKDPRDRPSTAGEIRKRIDQSGLADSWTAERAEKWWKLHMPEKNVMGKTTGVREQVNAEA
jgi:hypothetical protein